MLENTINENQRFLPSRFQPFHQWLAVVDTTSIDGVKCNLPPMYRILHFLKPGQKGILPLLHFLEVPVALHFSYSLQEYNLNCRFSM